MGKTLPKTTHVFAYINYCLYLCTTEKIFIRMKISYKWLKEYVDFDLTPQETADALTSTGLEVDSLDEVESIKAA